MYITKLQIDNIRSISHYEMTFEKPAGWHVVIGDNAAGKSSIIRAIATGLLGEDDAKALAAFSTDFSTWMPPSVNDSTIVIEGTRDNKYDMPAYKGKKMFKSAINLFRVSDSSVTTIVGNVVPTNAIWGQYSSNNGWFIAAYGPFRRLKGNYEAVVNSRPRLGACITAFRDDVALVHLISWMKDLALDSGKKQKARRTIDEIVRFINDSELLPGGAQLTNDVDSDGIKLQDGNNVSVSLLEMSDGFRSILSMVLDIIRYMIEVYGIDKVFQSGKTSKSIDLPGVVLIDEVDAHLHPAWQTKIGQWFTNCFPGIQFIVTTHSPLVCRACENGSIWRLRAPGGVGESGMVTGVEKDKLIYGNILDAYGTELFGDAPVKTGKTDEKRKRLGQLNRLFTLRELTSDEERERLHLQSVLATDVTD